MVDLKSMTKKEKVEYIWDYYKLHIIGCILLIGIIASLIYGQVTKIDYVVNITMIGSVVEESKRAELEKKLTSLVVKEGQKKKEAFVEAIPTNKSEIGYQMMQKFVVKVAAGEIDLIVLDKELFDNYVKQDMFLPLNTINEISLDSFKQEKIEASGTGERAIYAIRAEGSNILNDIGVDTKDKVIGIAASSKHKENAILVLKEFLNK